MRKLTCAILPLLAGIMLCSCGSSEKTAKPVKLDENFKAQATMTVDGTEYTANLTRNGADIWECEFTAPETIEGMVMTCSGDSAELEFMGLKYKTDRANIPESSAVTLTSSVIEKIISQKDVDYMQNDKGTITVSGDVKGQDFTAKMKKGKLCSLSVSSELEVKFS